MGSLDLKMIEQALALRDVVSPIDALDPAAGLSGLPPIENDAGVAAAQMLERLGARIGTERRPGVERRIESARREHQQRRTRAQRGIASRNSVDGNDGHGSLRTPA